MLNWLTCGLPWLHVLNCNSLLLLYKPLLLVTGILYCFSITLPNTGLSKNLESFNSTEKEERGEMVLQFHEKRNLPASFTLFPQGWPLAWQAQRLTSKCVSNPCSSIHRLSWHPLVAQSLSAEILCQLSSPIRWLPLLLSKLHRLTHLTWHWGHSDLMQREMHVGCVSITDLFRFVSHTGIWAYLYLKIFLL